jgi:hypothetical protein
MHGLSRTIGLPFQCLLARVVCALDSAALLLDRMGKLMGYEVITLRGAGPILARGERDIAANGKGAGAEFAAEPGCH